MRDAGHYLDWLDIHPGVCSRPVGIVRYCMGAALALRKAETFPQRVAAAAGFHGGNLATDDAASPHLLADRISAELYFRHADHDHSLPPEQIQRLTSALDHAGIRHRTEVYTGAQHGYTEADTSAYHPDATERHWAALLDLFGRALHP
jgi:carboxymethylenebutenolidase